jgi:transposase
VLPKRWIVERTFGWLTLWRIMNRHHERKYDSAENIMRIAMTKNMLRYLTMNEVKNIAA